MSAQELMEAKLIRLAESRDEAALAFITILLGGDGFCGKEQGYPQGFSDYRTHWGEAKFEEVKKGLVEEGLLKESESCLALNLPQIESLEDSGRQELVRPLAEFLFEQARPFYTAALKETLAYPEGRYILTELAKVGPVITDESVAHISVAAGHKYWQQAKLALSKAGLLLWWFSSKKHDYYRLFPPLISLIKTESAALRDALAFVYIAQHVREGCGVLVRDMPYRSEADQLTVLGLVEQLHWYGLSGFGTTRDGESMASSILQERLKNSSDHLIGLLKSLPPKLVEFIIRECVLSQYDQGRYVSRPEFGFGVFEPTFETDEPSHLCLLEDGRISGERSKLFEAWVKEGLMAKVHSYVSTRGGETRELVYVPSPELRTFLREYLVTQNIPGPVFTPEFEAKHRLYHFLLPSYEPFQRGDLALPGFEYPPLTRDEELRQEAQKALDRLIQAGLVVEQEGKLVVTTRTTYRQAVRAEFFLPLVDYVLETKTMPAPKEKRQGEDKAVKEAPIMPFKITFPPYDDGSCLVFGRGLLKDKIALGFEAEKQVSSENLFLWGLHDINQPFVASFQQVGMGKSTLASCIMLQSAFQGVPVIVFDPKPDYVASLAPVSQTIKAFPDYEKGIRERFEAAMQDMRGFDLARPLDFELEEKKLRLVYQVYSFNPDLHRLGVRPLKMPLTVLPPASAPHFREMCASAATTLASSLHSRWQQMAYNATLAEAMQNYKKRNPDSDYMLPKDLEDELERIMEAEEDKTERRRLKNLMTALKGYATANAWLYASTREEVARLEDLVQNPGYKDGDGSSVTVTVLDVSWLPQEKRNPARQNYVSQVCGFLYNLAVRKRSPRAAQFVIVFDEAHNYLPEPTDRFNNTLVLIRQGRALGIKALVIAQSPQQIEIEARKQAHALILAKITAASVREELTKFQPHESWTGKLGATSRGQALIIDSQSAKVGGTLCTLFTTPQTINLLNPDQIMSLSGKAL
ncbi:MAG TPA: ATP-binding protein [Dehalococcoidia bacterium]|nr:ATP-binding protein [Dehalococcoidia bacterium]